MTPQEFLDEFGTLAESAEGVPKLRELILELAVRGKLVEQDESDETAATVLDKLRQEKARLVKEKSIPKPVRVDDVNGDEPYAIPESWQWERLGNVSHFIEAGWSPRCESHPRSGVDWGVLKISAVTWGTFNPDENKALPANLEPRPKCEVQAGDFVMSRANTSELVAKSVVVHDTPPHLMLNDKLLRVSFPDSINPRFVSLYNNGPTARDYYVSVASGTSVSMRNVSRANVASLAVPVPPLAEQHRIVSKVDELMGLCDRLEAVQGERRGVRVRLNRSSLDRLTSVSGVGARQRGSELSAAWQRVCDHFEVLYDTPETLPDLRQTILQLAVQGKLVPQDPNDEPPAIKLAQVNGQRPKPRWQFDALLDSEIPFSIPKTWEWGRILDGVQRVTVGHVGSMKEEYTDGGVPFLRTLNVRENRYEPYGLKFVSREFHESLQKSSLAPNDVVVVRSGNVGTSCVIPTELPEANCSDLVIIKQPVAFDPTFIAFYMNSAAKAHVAAGTVGVALTHFNTKSVAGLPIPIPPLSEQKRIVSKVTHLLSQAARLESTLTRRESTRTQLFTAAIHSILNGRP